jgi:hypothetical protein
MELVKNLNKKLLERYAKQMADLNKNVYPSAKNSNGSFEAPVIELSTGGGTVNPKTSATKAPPARVSVEMKNLKPFDIVYRLLLPMSECEIADKNPLYFNHLFDKILGKALGNYKATVGDENVLRFGEKYISMEIKDLHNDEDTKLKDISYEYLELVISGCWASEEEDAT